MPKISIIIPVYKVELYLDKCIESVLQQTFHDYELILVDDGSPDQCGEICDRYALQDQRIKVIHKANGGLSDARNAALEIITGNFITFIDSDDYIAPNHINSLYEALINNDADISIANISTVTKKSIIESFYQPVIKETVLEGPEIFSVLNQPCAPAKLYRKEIYQDIRFPVGRLYEDLFIFHNVLSKAKRIVLTGMNTYFYLVREGSIMNQEYRYEFTDIVDAIESRIDKLEELGLQDLANDNRVFIYSRVAVAFANLDPKIPRNKSRLIEIKRIYNKEFPKLIKNTAKAKQKILYLLLLISPKLHTKLFGKKLKKVLG